MRYVSPKQLRDLFVLVLLSRLLVHSVYAECESAVLSLQACFALRLFYVTVMGHRQSHRVRGLRTFKIS